ncbi:MAG: phosphatase [Oscillospiraceae bacterium]|jgi:putative hydrolase|nr:phosphatase [Oscillospiraceae bacterium]
MNFIADLHMHTVASTHAYSTLQEMTDAAAERGLAAIAVTDHGVTMPGAPGKWYFENLRSVPRHFHNVMVLRGQETNILDYDGHIDVLEKDLETLDWLVASIHSVCMPKKERPTPEKVTHLWEQVCKNPRINVIGHCGAPEYAFDYEHVIPQFGAAGKLVELNESSFRTRLQYVPNCRKIMELCKKYAVPVVVDSDAHFSTLVGDFPHAEKLLEELDFPEELVVNSSKARLEAYLKEYTGVFNTSKE